MPDGEGDLHGGGTGVQGNGSPPPAADGESGPARGEEAEFGSRPVPSTEDLVEAYKAAGENEKCLVRALLRSGQGQEAERLTEILYYFPGTKLTR